VREPIKLVAGAALDAEAYFGRPGDDIVVTALEVATGRAAALKQSSLQPQRQNIQTHLILAAHQYRDKVININGAAAYAAANLDKSIINITQPHLFK